MEPDSHNQGVHDQAHEGVRRMPAVYIHLSGEDLGLKYQQVYGSGKPVEVTRPAFAPPVCPTTNGTTSTSTAASNVFTTDLTMLIEEHLINVTHPNLESIMVMGSSVQSWKVDERAIHRVTVGMPDRPGTNQTAPAFLWFEKATLLKVRESYNYTDTNGYAVVSVLTLESTNIKSPSSVVSSTSSSSSLPAQVSTASNQGTFIASASAAFLVVAGAAFAVYRIRRRLKYHSKPAFLRELPAMVSLGDELKRFVGSRQLIHPFIPH
jgi:hypothetical protein